MGKLRQDRGKRAWSPPNSTMRMMRVTAKQKHQVNMDQLPMAPVQAPTLATSEKATQVEMSCSRRRRPRGWASARADPTVVGKPRPEDDDVVVMVVRVTVTGMAGGRGKKVSQEGSQLEYDSSSPERVEGRSGLEEPGIQDRKSVV